MTKYRVNRVALPVCAPSIIRIFRPVSLEAGMIALTERAEFAETIV